MMSSYRNHPINDYASVVGPDTQFIDVRQPTEVADGSMPTASNIPLNQLADRLAELDPTQRTVVLCRSGGRSAQAALVLAGAEFVDVVNLTGGILEFSEGAQR